MAVLALADLGDPGTGSESCSTLRRPATLRLLALPETFRAVIDLLDTMQGKHRFWCRPSCTGTDRTKPTRSSRTFVPR
jgi:hypothetical protein